MNPLDKDQDVYSPLFQETYLPDEDIATLDLSMDDDVLDKMLIQSLEDNTDYWNKSPWKLAETDTENVKYLLGDQQNQQALSMMGRSERDTTDNRLFSATRAILSYATGQLAVPEITPSRSDDQYVKMARAIQNALYQHAADEKVDQKTRAAVMNLVVRKRGYLKVRFDPNAGTYGDIVTEVCNPEDIIIDRNAKFMDNPNIIYHRLRCTVDELISKFPNKANEIRAAYSIKQGRYSQMSKFVTYFEAWFTYIDKNIPREGLCWFIPEHHLILDKMKNPNWVYTGDDQKDKEANVLTHPPKPFTWFNYLNMGHSFIDETCLFEQAKPQQEMLNKRLRQFNDNTDYANGRWIANKKAMSEEDATKMVNKGAKTIGLVNAEDVTKAFANISADALPVQVYQSIQDTRNEIDTMMGTPSIFRGEQPQSQDTLGRDLMVKQQAGMLQDDLVRAVSLGMEQYYQILLQMMRTYYTEDYWFQVKGGDGKFDFVMLNGDSIDANVKIGVQVDSTLPLDKAQIRNTSMLLAKMGRIDNLTLFEDLGVPDPEIRTERLLRSQIDPLTYMQSVEQGLDNNDAEVDIMLLENGKDPQERDNYDEGYLNFFNNFITTNKFAMLDQSVKQDLVQFLQIITQKAQASASLQTSMLDDAGILERPVTPPVPKKDIRITGTLDPAQSAQEAGLQPTPQPPPTV